jgi:hypothetical protein
MAMRDKEWFMWSIDAPMPRKLTIYTGGVNRCKAVRTITRHQAMALARWHEPLYFSYTDGNHRWCDVHVVGDIDEWFGNGDEE